jgi:hypothetical protein
MTGPLHTLPGPSAARLLLRGVGGILAAFVVGCGVVAESYLPGPWYFWAIGILIVVLVLLVIGVSQTLRGYKKGSLEKERGYTTFRGDAQENPALYYLDRKSLAVIWAPGQRTVR